MEGTFLQSQMGHGALFPDGPTSPIDGETAAWSGGIFSCPDPASSNGLQADAIEDPCIAIDSAWTSQLEREIHRARHR